MKKPFSVYSSLEERRCFLVVGIDESPLRFSEILIRRTSFNCINYVHRKNFLVGDEVFWNCIVYELELKDEINVPKLFLIETLLLMEIMDVLKEYAKFICKNL